MLAALTRERSLKSHTVGDLESSSFRVSCLLATPIAPNVRMPQFFHVIHMASTMEW